MRSAELEGERDETLLRAVVEIALDAAASGTLYDIAVVSADGKTTLAKSLWSAVGEKRLTFTVCGQRSLLLRVVRKGEPDRFRVTFSRP